MSTAIAPRVPEHRQEGPPSPDLHDNPVPGNGIIFKYPHGQLPRLQDPIGLPGEGHTGLVSEPHRMGPTPGDGCPVPPREGGDRCGGWWASLGALHQLCDVFSRAVPVLIGRLVAHHEDPLVGVDGWEASPGHCTEQGKRRVRLSPWTPPLPARPTQAYGTPDSQGLLGMRTAGQSPSRSTSATPWQEMGGLMLQASTLPTPPPLPGLPSPCCSGSQAHRTACSIQSPGIYERSGR